MQEVRRVRQVSEIGQRASPQGDNLVQQREGGDDEKAEPDNGAEPEICRDGQAQAQHANAEADKFMATRQTGADRLHGTAREEEIDALEDVLRIDLTRGPSGNGDDNTQDETQLEAGSEKRCHDEKKRIDQHFDRDTPDGSVERHREFVDPIRSKRQLKREMKGVITAIDK